MPSTRDIRRRIKSVKNTAQITKAMQMVAAAKMRKAQQNALVGRPYAELMNEVLSYAAARTVSFEHPLMEARPVKKRAIILVSSDRGLCGGLNSNLFREVVKFDKNTTIYITAGRKSAQFVARTKRPLAAEFTYKDAPTFAEGRAISKFAQDLFLKGEADAVDILFSKFVSTLVQTPKVIPFLPVGKITAVTAGINAPAEELKQVGNTVDTFEFEPDEKTVLGALLPHSLNFPDLARGQGQRAERPHGGHEKRDGQREADHQGPDARIQQTAPGEHYEGTVGNHHGANGGRLKNKPSNLST
jgi:F-type H+-transporting ATPase subunit gamma